MARVSTYLNFQGQAEEAFAFYAKTFGTEVTMLSRSSGTPPGPHPHHPRRLITIHPYADSAASTDAYRRAYRRLRAYVY